MKKTSRVLISCIIACFFSNVLASPLENLKDLVLRQNLTSESDIEKYWPKTPQDFQKRKRHVFAIVDEAQEYLNSQSCTHENAYEYMQVFDLALGYLENLYQYAEMFALVHHNSVMRKHAYILEADCRKRQIDFFLITRRVYENMKKALSDDIFDDKDRYSISQFLDSYQQLGFHLKGSLRQKARYYSHRIQDLKSQFARNIQEDVNHVFMTDSELIGLSSYELIKLKKDAFGVYQIPVNYPNASIILRKCKNPRARKRYYSALNNVGYPANKYVLPKLLQMRNAFSVLLGYSNFAEMDLSNQMLKKPKYVHKLIDDLHPIALHKAKKEMEYLNDKLQLKDPIKVLAAHDVSYYVKQTLKESDHFRDYFPIDAAMKGLARVCKTFFGYTMRFHPNAKLWDPEVILASIEDTSGVLGWVAFDLFPRIGKYRHGCHGTVISAYDNGQQKVNYFGIIVGNFARGHGSKPPTLSHGELRTLFHEFGHASHALFGRSRWMMRSGTMVTDDFVETPSIFLEKWVSDPTFLAEISSHYETKQGLSLNEAKDMVNSHPHTAFRGFHLLHQLAFSKLAVLLHEGNDDKDPFEMSLKAMREYHPLVIHDPNNHKIASWGHLSGYASKYYCYLLSDMIAEDLYTKVSEEGLCPETGKNYVEKVLKPAGTVDPNQLIESFLGRKFDQEAYIRALLK